MIKFHPSSAMLNDHLAGKLPLSLTVAVSAHIEMCAQCRQQVKKLESSQAEQLWQISNAEAVDFSDMLHNILAEQPETALTVPQQPEAVIEVAQQHYRLPVALSIFSDLKWSRFGPVSRARVINNENEIRANLLHIGKGASISRHQHKGYELTLLLEGSFSDENGRYHKGDFILLDGADAHAPYSEKGCLCYVVQNAPLHFVAGVSKVLNPLAGLLY